jgi:hypothetical protein
MNDTHYALFCIALIFAQAMLVAALAVAFALCSSADRKEEDRN